VRGNLTTMIWKDKRYVNMLMNMQHPPPEGNFCDELENALKLAIVQDCLRHMGYVDKSDHMTNIAADGPGSGQRNCFFTN